MDSDLKLTRYRQSKVLVLSVIAVVLLALIVIILDRNEIRQIIGKANWLFSFVALLFAIISYLCLSVGYVIVNRAFGIKIGWRELLEIGFVSTALNNVLAFMGAAGHSLRLVLIGRRGVAPGDALAASIFHSYLNNVMMLMVLVAGLVYVLASHTVYGGGAVGLGLLTGLSTVFLIIVTAMIVVSPLRLLILGMIRTAFFLVTRRNITTFLSDFDRALRQSVVVLRGRGPQLAQLLSLMAADWIFAIITLWFCFQAFGGGPNIGVVLSGFSIGIAAGNLSLIPGGIGVQEASMAGVFALLGSSLGQAVLVSILFRVIYDFIPFFLSLLLYGRLIRGRHRAR